MITAVDLPTFAARRNRLRSAITQFMAAIVAGEVTPIPAELEALAQLCDEQFLPVEAARVRRWIAP